MFDFQERTESSEPSEDSAAQARVRLTDIQDRFIDRWGDLANIWGTQRSGGRMHGLLFVSPEPMHAEGIGDRLQISHGNTSTTVRQLLGNGVIRRLHRPGERKAYYTSEPDPWQWMRNTIRQRVAREVMPVMEAMRTLLRETEELECEAPADLAAELRATRDKITVVLRFLEQLLAMMEAFLEQPPSPGSR